MPAGIVAAGDVRDVRDISRGVASGIFTTRSSSSSVESKSWTTTFSSCLPSRSIRESACVPEESSTERVPYVGVPAQTTILVPREAFTVSES